MRTLTNIGILVADEIGLKSTLVKRDFFKGLFTLTKGIIHKDDIAF